jgi:D-alanine-D-alanine ligase
MHIAVLKGGLSEERDVSLASGAAVEVALKALGHQVSAIDVARDVALQLKEIKPDLCFNALHGRYGEDGAIQGLLEFLGIPYTHSGVLASALAMDKPMAKTVFAAAGLRCAEGMVVSKTDMLRAEPMARPYVVKPLNEGSSVGVTIVTDDEDFTFEESNWHFGEAVLVERYIPGREIQVAVLDGKALGAIEVKPQGKFYDYKAKYTDGMAEHVMPAKLDKARYDEVCSLAERAHLALHCRGLSRADFRFYDVQQVAGGDDQFYLLEINTQPGMTPLSLAPEIAAHAGISFAQLVEKLVLTARTDGDEACTQTDASWR